LRELASMSGWEHSTVAKLVWPVVLLMEQTVVKKFLVFPDKERQMTMGDAFECEDLRKPIIPENMRDWKGHVERSPPLRLIGIEDGTYCMITHAEKEHLQGLHYTKHKKFHACKLNVVCNTHKEGEILLVGMSVGKTSDKLAHVIHTQPKLASSVKVGGDKAYEGVETMVIYFKKHHYSRVAHLVHKHGKEHPNLKFLKTEMIAFDKRFQKYRMRVEQAIGRLKQWAFVRGRSSSKVKKKRQRHGDWVQSLCRAHQLAGPQAQRKRRLKIGIEAALRPCHRWD